MSRHTAKVNPSSSRMTIPELAKAMECSETAAYQMAESGRFGSFKEGRRYFVSRRAVQNWIDGKVEAPVAPISFLRHPEPKSA